MIDWEAILAEHGSTVWRTVFRLLDHHADALDSGGFLVGVGYQVTDGVLDAHADHFAVRVVDTGLAAVFPLPPLPCSWQQAWGCCS